MRSPLHIFVAGSEAVIVFFVLSGFVLTLPFVPKKKVSWRSYYPKRIVRLWLPAIASVALAVMFALLVPRLEGVGTWWVNDHARPVSGSMVVSDASLLAGTGKYNSVLWSLKWEVLFSFLLPLYVLLARRARRYWFLGSVVMGAISTLGELLEIDVLKYLPIFGIGVFLAVGRESISQLLANRPWAVVGVGVTSAVSFAAFWAVPWSAGSPALLLIACATAVTAFYGAQPLAHLSETPVVSWLGARSFSLYLVHEPILVSAALVAPKVSWPLTAVLGAVVALIVTEIFYRLVEVPGMRLASMVGRAAAPRRQ